MLLPPSMQDKTEFMPLGRAIKKPEPVKADPVRDFEKHNHDIPGAPKLPRVTPEMAARALRSLCVDGLKEAFVRISKQYEASINQEYEDRWDDLFQKQAAKQMERLDKLSELSKPPALTWPTLPDLPEPTFLPEVVHPAPADFDDPLSRLSDTEKRVRAGFMVFEVEKQLAATGFSRINKEDMAAIRDWFGPLGTPAKWDGCVFAYSFMPRMAV